MLCRGRSGLHPHVFQATAIVVAAACAAALPPPQGGVLLSNDMKIGTGSPDKQSATPVLGGPGLRVLGVAGSMGGATLTVIGFLLQKHSHQRSVDSYRYYWTEKYWLAGLAVWIVGQVTCYLASGLVSQSLIACFNCWNIVAVFVFAPFCFGEAISKQEIFCAIVIIFGCTWVVLAGPKNYHQQTVGTIVHAFGTPPFVVILCISAVSLAAFAARWLMTFDARQLLPATRQISPIEFAGISAVFAWYTILLTKAVSTLIATSVNVNQFQLAHWEVLVFIPIIVMLGVCQMHFLNMGLKDGDATSVVPTYEAASMAGQIIVCGTFFGEFSNFDLWCHVGFWSGVLVVICGVISLSRAKSEASRKRLDENDSSSQGSGKVK